MLKNFMDGVLREGTKGFFSTFGIAIVLVIILLALVSCKGPVEFYPVSESWLNPNREIPMKEVCQWCVVDQSLTDHDHSLYINIEE